MARLLTQEHQLAKGNDGKKHKKKPRSANKIGRNLKKASRYEGANRREANKERRAKRIQRGFRSA